MIRAAQREAHQRLADALVQAAEARQSVPCAGRLEWVSDELPKRRWASLECAPCPVLDTCREAGQKERSGVWGGRDQTRGP